MELMIQDPTYALSMRLGEALIDACKKSIGGAGAFAFAEANAIDIFLGDSDFKDFIKNYKYDLVVGTDSITDSRAVARLRAYCTKYSNLQVYGYVHDARRYLFHPKMSWFQTATGGVSIIGSGNLTERGLYHNMEMYAYNTLNTAQFNTITTDWDNWMNYSINNNFIFAIDDPIIDYAVNLSVARRTRSTTTGTTGTGATAAGGSPGPILTNLYKKQPKPLSVSKPRTGTPAGTPVGRMRPKRATTVIASPIPKVTPVPAAPAVNPIWTVNLTDRVLIAEVPKSSKRWKQVNFDKTSFVSYFGATPGGTAGTYRILLKNVDPTGQLGDTESRPSVSVISHNWRFEISAAKGLPYPTGVNRPYVVFSEASTRSFLYELLMPGDPGYTDVDNYVNTWKGANGVRGLARIITDVNSFKPSTPTLGLWKV